MKSYERFANPTDSRYRRVDPLFNLGRSRSLDLIDEKTGRRLLFSLESNPDSETLLYQMLGKSALLPYLGDAEGGYRVHGVTPGARLLSSTLNNPPYNQEYMKKLELRAQNLLDQISRLDHNRFGLTIGDIAIAHDGVEDNDDAYLTALPPLS